MPDKTLHDIEHAAWSQRASFYDDLFASVSSQAIAPILDSLGDLPGKRHLDVACGTGHLVAAASQRGAVSEGVDFAKPMIDIARTSYPDQCFKMADAAHLPYEDASLDMVSCSFGLSHMENPQAAVNEAFRVLRAGGRFAFTLWFDAENGAELFAIGRDALTRYATQTVEFPPAWTQLRFADTKSCENLVNRAGFKLLAFLRLPLMIRSTNAQVLLDILGKLSVRTRIILDSQPLAARQRIYEYSLSEIEARRVDGQITLGAPALLTVVEKPEREE